MHEYLLERAVGDEAWVVVAKDDGHTGIGLKPFRLDLLYFGSREDCQRVVDLLNQTKAVVPMSVAFPGTSPFGR
jgi:hypothetical protein